MTIKFLLVESVYSHPEAENDHPSLGLGYIASSLRKEFGEGIIFKVVRYDLASEIKAFQPDVVGISSVSKNFNIAKENARIAKRYGLPVIAGGVHISFMPQNLTPDMDVGVVGEGESTIVELMSSFAWNKQFVKSELKLIDGIMYHDGGGVVVTKPRKLIRPLDTIPYPARDLLTVDRHASMMTSRGCPYHCAFCSTSRFTGNQVRYASAGYVADEVEHLYKQYGVGYITVGDDMFAIKPKRVVEIAKLLGAKNILGKVKFAINTRADFITDELADTFKRLNVDTVGMGVETGCQKTLDYLKDGNIAVEDSARAIKLLKAQGIKVYCSLILGSPQESKADMMETVDFIRRNKARFLAANILTPFPGTPVWDYALSRGLVSDDMDWKRLFFNINHDPIILSEKMSREEIFEVYKILMDIKERARKRRQKLLIARHPHRFILPGIRKIARAVCH